MGDKTKGKAKQVEGELKKKEGEAQDAKGKAKHGIEELKDAGKKALGRD